MGGGPGGLAGHQDRMRWNARYGSDFEPSFEPHPLAVRALSLRLPDGPVADLACGPSGSALLAADALYDGVHFDQLSFDEPRAAGSRFIECAFTGTTLSGGQLR